MHLAQNIYSTMFLYNQMVAMAKIVPTDSKTGGLCRVIPNTREYPYDEMPLCIQGAVWPQTM